jgi:import inner membrane translocase subunit TIM44
MILLVRPARYRRLHVALRATQLLNRRYITRNSHQDLLYTRPEPLHSGLRPQQLQPLTSRSFFHKSAAHTVEGKHEDIRDPPRRESTSRTDQSPDPVATSSAEGERSSEHGTDRPAGEEAKKEQKQKQESAPPPPPPPPHGDKTPWQVFTETLRNEFKASKEWNESTKALASSAHQFTENESIKRAKAAYTAASGAATSTTTSALKNTGKVLGKGAAWTWETPVVKTVRKGVSATGKGLDKVTKPVRETAAFKTVKEVIDDGSSSRYGGWIEKEERRKKRELRELHEAQISGRTGRRTEKIEEDPK